MRTDNTEIESSSTPVAGSLSRTTLQLRADYQTAAAHRTELLLGPTGRFRKLIEAYMGETAPSSYKAKDLNTVRNSLGSFFKFVAKDLHIREFEQIRPSTVTKYVEFRSSLGYVAHNFLGHLSSFFNWLIVSGRYDRGNPVVKRLHRDTIAALKSSSPNGLHTNN